MNHTNKENSNKIKEVEEILLIIERKISSLSGDLVKIILSISAGTIALSITFISNFKTTEFPVFLIIGWILMFLSIIFVIILKYINRDLSITRYNRNYHLLWNLLETNETKSKKHLQESTKYYGKEIKKTCFPKIFETLTFLAFIFGLAAFLVFGIKNIP